MNGRVALAGWMAVLLLSPASAARAAPRSPAALPRVPVPAAGNVTVARLAIKSIRTGGAGRAPRLTVATTRSLPPGTFVVATVGRAAPPGRFLATVAIVYPGAPSSTAQPTRFVSLRLPPGFSLLGVPKIVRDVLYSNQLPPFGLATARTGSLLAGEAPPKLPIARIVTDAQLLTLDRSVPVADMELLGLQYVAAQVSRTSTTMLAVAIGMSRLSQVNAVELRFPSGITVARVSGPAGVDSLLLGSAVQLVASTGFFQEGVAYGFTLELSRAPRKGDFVTLRASTHYFESTLPFTESFALY
jgi:hypothetical protein